MGPQPDTAWISSQESLHARAWWCLNHSGNLAPNVNQGRSFHGIPRLRLWDDARGFGNEGEPMTLTVFELFGEGGALEPVVREAIWQRRSDLYKLQENVQAFGKITSLTPTISLRDAPVPADRFLELLREATAFHIPVVWLPSTCTVTTDVGAVGFEFFSQDQPPAVLRLQWSDSRPASWEPVVEWFDRLRAFLAACLSGSTRDG
jgi:hypothetical protein